MCEGVILKWLVSIIGRERQAHARDILFNHWGHFTVHSIVPAFHHAPLSNNNDMVNNVLQIKNIYYFLKTIFNHWPNLNS